MNILNYQIGCAIKKNTFFKKINCSKSFKIPNLKSFLLLKEK